jgi:hypothetical protein
VGYAADGVTQHLVNQSLFESESGT